MAESQSERILAQVVTVLAGIVGDSGTTYWHTYKVARSKAIEATMLDPSLDEDALLILVPEIVDNQEETNREITKLLRFDVIGAKKHSLPDGVFDADIPIRWTVQNRIEQDVEKKLRVDVTLGGLSENVELPTVDMSAETTFVEGWALVLINVLIKHSINADTP